MHTRRSNKSSPRVNFYPYRLGKNQADQGTPCNFRKWQRWNKNLPAAPGWNFQQEIGRQFSGSGILQKIKPGSRIALAVGSRGIANLREIVLSVVGILRNTGAEVFIIPAMGSHGGGTPEGQAHVLADYGITPESTGVKMDSRMQARKVGRTSAGIDVFVSEAAMEADGIFLINRVKPHTDFSGSMGSGLLKMCVIGLG